MLRKYIEIRERVRALINEEVGSEVTQATGVAMVAIGMLTVLIPFGDDLGKAVKSQFTTLNGLID